jgi:hypothetical protein
MVLVALDAAWWSLVVVVVLGYAPMLARMVGVGVRMVTWCPVSRVPVVLEIMRYLIDTEGLSSHQHQVSKPKDENTHQLRAGHCQSTFQHKPKD